jgi:hypothetical protein
VIDEHKPCPKAEQNRAQKKSGQAQPGHCPEQPAQVVAGRAEHGMQSITQLPTQPAAIHAVIRLQVPDGWLDRLAAPEPTPLLHAGIVPIDAAKAQIDHDFLCFKAIPANLAACTTLLRAISSSRPSTGSAGVGGPPR